MEIVNSTFKTYKGGGMRYRSTVAVFLIAFLCLPLFGAPASSSYNYIEGTDTTTADGKSINGFTVSATSINGAAVVYGSTDYGYLNCMFDDVQKVPDSIISPKPYVENVFLHCFIVSGNSNTWMKVQVTKQLPDKRFVYRFGKNMTSSSKLLLPPNYDQQRIYRPNNVRWSEVYYRNGEIVQEITLVWEPPIPCNKKVTGYIVYGSSQDIDTAKPIDLKQWRQIVTTTGTSASGFSLAPRFNVAAVYQDQTTDFPKAYTRLNFPMGVTPHRPLPDGNHLSPLAINSFGPKAPAPWYAVNGRLVSKRGFSDASWGDLATGWYFRPTTISDGGGMSTITAIGR